MARKKATSPSPAEQDLIEHPVAEDSAPDAEIPEATAPCTDEPEPQATETEQSESQAEQPPCESEEAPQNIDAASDTDEGATSLCEDNLNPDAVGEDALADTHLSAEERYPTDGTPPDDSETGEDDMEALLHDLGQMPQGDMEPMSSAEIELGSFEGSNSEEGKEDRREDELLLMPGDLFSSEEDSPGDPGEESGDRPEAPEPAHPDPPVKRQRKQVPAPQSASEPAPRSAEDPLRDRILTIDPRERIISPEDTEAIVWHEIQNSNWTRRILTGVLYGVEETKSGYTVALVNYKGFRVAIPLKDMLLYPGKMPAGKAYQDLIDHMSKILTTRMNSEVDFIVKGHNNKERSVIASRKDAMYRKRQTFYMDTDNQGEPLIHEGRIVQARVIAVSEKLIRVEVFGVECPILARDLSWEWIGNAKDEYEVGDKILVRVLEVHRPDIDNIKIRVDVRSITSASSLENFRRLQLQGRYVGRVTDVRNGVAYIRLLGGVNAIAHSCNDIRYPGKKDDVSFVVTRLDEERLRAYGIITRIIKQNL